MKITSKLMLLCWIYQNLTIFDCLHQGSVATQLRCGGVNDNDPIANFLLNQKVIEFWKSVNIWHSYNEKYCWSFFDSQCTYASAAQNKCKDIKNDKLPIRQRKRISVAWTNDNMLLTPTHEYQI